MMCIWLRCLGSLMSNLASPNCLPANWHWKCLSCTCAHTHTRARARISVFYLTWLSRRVEMEHPYICFWSNIDLLKGIMWRIPIEWVIQQEIRVNLNRNWSFQWDFCMTSKLSERINPFSFMIRLGYVWDIFYLVVSKIKSELVLWN